LSRLPRITGRDLVRALRRAGFQVVGVAAATIISGTRTLRLAS